VRVVICFGKKIWCNSGTLGNNIQNLLYFAESRSRAPALTLQFHDKPIMTKRFSFLRRSSALSWRLNLLLRGVVACAALVLCGNMLRAQSAGAAWRYLGPDGASVTHIAASNDTLYAATNYGSVFRSVDGITWTPMNLFGTGAEALTASSGCVLAVYYNQVLLSRTVFTFSTTGGGTTQNITHYQYITQYQNSYPSQIALSNSKIITVNRKGIAIGDFPQMQSYRVVLTSATITCLASMGDMIYAGSKGGQLLRSRNFGSSWLGISLPFEPKALAAVNATSLFAASTNAIYVSQDAGLFWQQTGSAPPNTTIQGLALAHGRLYAGTDKGAFFSTDLGKTWQGVNTGLSARYVSAIIANDSAVFASIDNPTIGGKTRLYQLINQNFVPFQLGRDTLPFMQVAGDFFFAISDTLLWRSKNGKDWISLGKLPYNLGLFGPIAAYENNRTYYAATSDGIYRSSDSGRTWQSAWLKGESVYNFGINQDTIYAFNTRTASIMSSVDNGRLWRIISRYNPVAISKVVPFRNSLYVITKNVYQIIDSPPPFSYSILYRLQGNGFLQDPAQGIIGGWTLIDYLALNLTSRRNEILWVPDNVQARSSGKIFGSRQIFGSSDGQRWYAYTTNGLANTNFTSLTANNQAIFVGTSGGLYVLDAPATTVAVRELAPLTTEWRINHQPTNNTLLFTVQLPSAAHVRCTLHTALGQEIATLADNAYVAGTHEITTTPQGMASGLYLCRLVVDGRVVGSKSVVVVR